MIWITIKDWMTPETAFSAPWVVVGRETPVTFQGLAEPVETTFDAVRKENTIVFSGKGGQIG
jgi:hypothetical protein